MKTPKIDTSGTERAQRAVAEALLDAVMAAPLNINRTDAEVPVEIDHADSPSPLPIRGNTVMAPTS